MSLRTTELHNQYCMAVAGFEGDLKGLKTHNHHYYKEFLLTKQQSKTSSNLVKPYGH